MNTDRPAGTQEDNDTQNITAPEDTPHARLSKTFISWITPGLIPGAIAGATTSLMILIPWLLLPPTLDETALLPLDTRLRTVETALSTLEQNHKALDTRQRQTPVADMALLRRDVETLKQQASQKSSNSPVNARDMEQAIPRLDELARRLAIAEKTLESTKTEADLQVDQTARLLTLANLLRTAIEEGRPFANELAAIKVIPAPPPLTLSSLDHAAPDMPDLNRLVEQFEKLKPAMIAALSSPTEKENTWDSSYLGRLIRVHPPQSPPESRIIDQLTHMERHIKTGHIEEALAIYRDLPESMRLAAVSWHEAARRFQTARQEIDQLISGLLATLAPSREAPNP